MASTPCRYPRVDRAGAVYVAVLGTAMIISLIALASIHLSRVEVDVLSGAEQMAHAELLAQSAVELAMCRINANSAWRTTYASGVENPSSGWTAVGAGGVRFTLVDADGNLADDARDSVTIRGIGHLGEATHVATVTAQPTADALDCLDVALHSGGAVTNSSSILGGHVVSANAAISGGTIDGDAWSTAGVSSTVSGVKNVNSTPARQMPDTTTVWDYYLNNGTRIAVADLPGDPTNLIDDCVISPGSNPFGSGETNSQGIYIIDCQGQGLRISDSRINATLVILNPGSTVEITGQINWNPPAANFPAMLVQGNLQMNWSGGADLEEFDWILVVKWPRTNFNPVGSPYEGLTDSDALDSYPGVINGLVYATGNLVISSACNVNGVVVVGGATTVSAATTLTYSQTPAIAPPPGFAAGNVLRIIPRTWRRSTR